MARSVRRSSPTSPVPPGPTLATMADPKAWALELLGFPMGTSKVTKKEVMAQFRSTVARGASRLRRRRGGRRPRDRAARRSSPDPARMNLLLFPGSGSSSTHPSLLAIAKAVAPMRCVRADFPYRKAGRKAPDRAPVLMQTVRDEAAPLLTGGLVLGGRSLGGRMCSMVVGDADDPLPAKGLVLISYPLHPPGKPDSLRVEHLPRDHGAMPVHPGNSRCRSAHRTSCNSGRRRFPARSRIIGSTARATT